MLQKKYHPLRASLKALAVIPVLGGLIFVLANRIQAQQTENNSVSVQKDNSSSTGISNDQMREFRNILNSYKVDGHLNSVNFRKNLSEQDRQKLQDLYLDMNNQQKSEQAIGFIPAPPPLPRVSPAGSQLHEWQNGSVYGVWVDGKRISNINLKDYAPADFSQVSVSKLSKNAINYGKHYYQVDLMTNAYYEKYLEENNANKNQYKMFFRFKAPKAPIIPLSSDTSLPDNIKSVEITTPSGKAIATITYKNGKKVTGDISTKEKLEAFENKYGVKIPAPPPPPPTPRPHHAPKIPQAPPAPPALSEKSAPPAPAHPSIPPPPPPPPAKHKK